MRVVQDTKWKVESMRLAGAAGNIYEFGGRDLMEMEVLAVLVDEELVDQVLV